MTKPNVVVGVRMPAEVYDTYKAKSKKTGRPATAYMRDALDPSVVRLSRDVAEDLLVLLDEKLLEDDAAAGLKTLRKAVWDSLEG